MVVFHQFLKVHSKKKKRNPLSLSLLTQPLTRRGKKYTNERKKKKNEEESKFFKKRESPSRREREREVSLVFVFFAYFFCERRKGRRREKRVWSCRVLFYRRSRFFFCEESRLLVSKAFESRLSSRKGLTFFFPRS